MAIRRDDPSDNGDGPRWLKKWREAQEKRSREHEESIGELKQISRENQEMIRELRGMNRASAARLARVEGSVELHREELEQSRRQTREIVAEVSRMDAERKRDRVQYARLFRGMLAEIRRIGR
ncbi:MAG: hypothetical protein AAB434_00045 [Planctomycetota bacterium]